jgi:hypothetical protein
MFYNEFYNKIFRINTTTVILVLLNILCQNVRAGSKEGHNSVIETMNFTVTVTDKSTSDPLQLVSVILKKKNSIVAAGTTNPFGRAIFNDIQGGSYEISTRMIGYIDFKDTVTIDKTHKSITIQISEKDIQLKEIEIKGNRVNSNNSSNATIDIISGQQTLDLESYHSAPTGSVIQLVQENLVGTAKAPTGEIHIRGQHGEFTYLIDGIPIPLGVFGGLNEIVDPKVISKVAFYTGGFPAEFGGQIAGLMDIQSRVPPGNFHLDFSTYGGSYLTSGDSLGSRVGSLKALNTNGQSISLSDHFGKLGVFFTGSRQETDRRIDQPVIPLFHDHGFDYFGYGKFDYLLNENDYITANLNYSKTIAQIPYDPSLGFLSDQQNSYNGFQTISFFHTLSAATDEETNFFIGGFAREGGLTFNPNVNDYLTVNLNGDSTKSYVVNQDRTFNTLGFRTKYDQKFSHQFGIAAGFNYSYTTGTDKFGFVNSSGDNLQTISSYSGYDFGTFIQAGWHPAEWTRIELGLRYDIHKAPQIADQTQAAPRFKWSFFIDEFNSFVLSYDKLFMPTNIENLGSVAALFGGGSTPALPEKDNLYEIDYIRNWLNGFNTKVAGFYKESSPGLDDQTLGSSTIRVNVNINKVRVTGLELAITYNDQDNPFSGYINGSIIHAYGMGPVSGGFLPPNLSATAFDLDHDQRLSAVIGIKYQPESWFIDITGVYGSGLTNGSSNYQFKTGLFDFNQGAHTSPAFIINVSGGYTINLGSGQTIEPSIFINNILDHEHLIKGAFFSGASYEERRNIMMKVAYHF